MDKQETLEYINDFYGGIDKKPNTELAEHTKECLKKFKKLIPLWKDIDVRFVNKLRKGELGCFVSETATSIPLILLSSKANLRASEECNVPLDITLATTLFHELGHAMCAVDRDLELEILEYGVEEEYVEEFAWDFNDYDDVSDDIKNLIKAMKKL